MSFKHGSLFSGIGGFDLAAEWMGWKNIFHCEMNSFCQKVLSHHFPNSTLHEDVKTFPASDYAGRIDILTGGFPCQPYSTAGKRRGKEDHRHLWPFMLKIIREIQPRYIVGENVYGLLNWNGGLVFEQICADLEAEGYEVQPTILPAAGIGAPHRRDRIWFVAYSDSSSDLRKSRRYESESKEKRLQQWDEVRQPTISDSVRDAPNTNNRRAGQEVQARGDKFASSTWSKFPTFPPICGGDDGLPSKLDGITFTRWRAESIKAYGNAIVPQVAYEIFKAIQKVDDERAKEIPIGAVQLDR